MMGHDQDCHSLALDVRMRSAPQWAPGRPDGPARNLFNRRVMRGHATPAGQALAELALVVPILIVILMGVLDIGRAYHTQVALSNAARVGLVYGQRSEERRVGRECRSRWS